LSAGRWIEPGLLKLATEKVRSAPLIGFCSHHEIGHLQSLDFMSPPADCDLSPSSKRRRMMVALCSAQSAIQSMNATGWAKSSNVNIRLSLFSSSISITSQSGKEFSKAGKVWIIPTMYFDTHVHFDDFITDGVLEQVLERAESANVCKMIAVGGSPEANRAAQMLAGNFPHRIYAAVGYDRHLAGTECSIPALQELAARQNTVAIGETGLDYFYEPDTARQQQYLFSQCLDVAVNVSKPVIIHTRDADDDTLAILSDFSRQWEGDPARIGVIHCFTRSRKMAGLLLDLGFYISISGIVTFSSAESLRRVIGFIPADRLLIETDSPYLAPVPHRGKRCEPAFVVETAKHLAELCGCTVESLAETTAKNAARLFGLE
jgi:TatD DNase family protein